MYWQMCFRRLTKTSNVGTCSLVQKNRCVGYTITLDREAYSLTLQSTHDNSIRSRCLRKLRTPHVPLVTTGLGKTLHQLGALWWPWSDRINLVRSGYSPWGKEVTCAYFWHLASRYCFQTGFCGCLQINASYSISYRWLELSLTTNFIPSKIIHNCIGGFTTKSYTNGENLNKRNPPEKYQWKWVYQTLPITLIRRLNHDPLYIPMQYDTPNK